MYFGWHIFTKIKHGVQLQVLEHSYHYSDMGMRAKSGDYTGDIFGIILKPNFSEPDSWEKNHLYSMY